MSYLSIQIPNSACLLDFQYLDQTKITTIARKYSIYLTDIFTFGNCYKQ